MFSVASLCLGGLGLLTALGALVLTTIVVGYLLFPVAVMVSLIGLVLGVIALMRNDQPRGLAFAGLAINALVLLPSVAIAIL